MLNIICFDSELRGEAMSEVSGITQAELKGLKVFFALFFIELISRSKSFYRSSTMRHLDIVLNLPST